MERTREVAKRRVGKIGIGETDRGREKKIRKYKEGRIKSKGIRKIEAVTRNAIA